MDRFGCFLYLPPHVSHMQLASKRTVAIAKREESISKIRQLGTLPGSELETFHGMSKRELFAKLSEVLEVSVCGVGRCCGLLTDICPPRSHSRSFRMLTRKHWTNL
jgi:hypothetical protein